MSPLRNDKLLQDQAAIAKDARRRLTDLETKEYDTSGGLTQEQIEDLVGAMVVDNNETGIAVTYDDTEGKLDFDVQTAGDARYAPIAEGVTNGDSHDHSGGDGAQISHANLSDIGSNSHATLDGHLLATSAHGASGAVVGTTNTQTLTNKTLTTPTIADFTNAQHDHGDADDGGALANDSVSNAMLANMAESTIKGRAAGAGTGDPTDLTATQVRTIINVEDGADVTDAANVGSSIHGATEKTTIHDDDEFAGIDTEASNVLKWWKWSTIKATLKSYFDTLYPTFSEGTWTPEIADAASAGNVGTAGTIAGLYTKHGKQVNISALLIDIDTTGMTAGNVLHIRNLPFTAKNNASYRSTGLPQLGAVTFSGYVQTLIVGNETRVRLFEITSGGAAAAIIVSDLTSGSADIIFSMTYISET